MNRRKIKNRVPNLQVEAFAYFQYMLFAEYTAGDGDQVTANRFAGVGSDKMVHGDSNKAPSNKLNQRVER